MSCAWALVDFGTIVRIGEVRSDAGVAKLADAQDLKSWVAQAACGFDSRPRHFTLASARVRAAGGTQALDRRRYRASVFGLDPRL